MLTFWRSVPYNQNMNQEKLTLTPQQWFDSIPTIDHDSTDDELFATVLDALLEKEHFYPKEMMDSMDMAKARQAANYQYREDVARWEYQQHRKTLNAIYKVKQGFHDQWLTHGWTADSTESAAVEAKSEMGKLKTQIDRLKPIVDMWWARVSYSWDMCCSVKVFSTSEHELMAAESYRQRKEKQKSPEQMVVYWTRLFNRAHYALERAQGRLAKAEARMDSAYNRGSDVSKHFPLGRVGGSGRNVRSLNRKREQDIDRGIQAITELKEAQKRVKTVELRTERYEEHLSRWEKVVAEKTRGNQDE